MTSHKQAVELWAKELEQLWREQETELVRAVGESNTKPFTHSLDSLQEALEGDGDGVDELAADAYQQWFVMTSNRGSNMAAKPDRVPIGGHRLPPLGYAYHALEPHIDEETMRLHHDKHHQSYVDGLNKAEMEMQKARDSGNFDLIAHWEREAAFNGAGHYLHTLFWKVMSPQGGGDPGDKLAKQIKKDFGSVKKMKDHFSAAAENVEGGGWALLIWAPRAHRLEILQAEKHQNLSQQDQVPLLALDVWEHAHYLKYKNERKPYIEAWWNVVNWPEVERRFAQAQKLRWEAY
ncbi:superoxide dismutase [Shouchella shacheensis]|uniref:superoxide dismutase n=1 Tax=Shouchella shacheensis TaxID=1649580 RepID=UPI00073FC4D8|nr:superoxide dismutase [Shouchella shacheensis]